LACEAECSGQADPWEEGRTRGADIGVGGPKLFLGFKDVRPVDEQLGREARGNVFDYPLSCERERLRKRRRQRTAHEEFESVANLLALQLEIGELGLRLGEQGPRFDDSRDGRHVCFEPQPADLKRAMAALHGRLARSMRPSSSRSVDRLRQCQATSPIWRSAVRGRRQVMCARGLG
jgi:hypothetical protein